MGPINVGTVDRVLRILLGLVLIGLALYGTIGPWGYIGIVPLLTGLVSRCLIYRIFGLSTRAR